MHKSSMQEGNPKLETETVIDKDMGKSRQTTQDFTISHIYQEANRPTDHLANQDVTQEMMEIVGDSL